MSDFKKSLSVVIPTYNEVEVVESMVSTLLEELGEYPLEILVVDDNSDDGTQEILKGLSELHSELVVVQRSSDRSLGRSIGEGIFNSSNEYVCIMDADLTHNPFYVHQMLALANKEFYAVGSRFCAGGSMPNKFHFLSSKFFNLFLRLYLRTGVNDNLSGFIVFHKSSLTQNAHRDIFFGYGDFFFRLISHLNKQGIIPREIPIAYRNRSAGRSKSNFVKLLFKYSWAAVTYPFAR